jgi:uncharacterized protein YaeQ
MALKATVFKASLNVADMDRHYYQDHTLTIARHPSETDLRMMTRLAVYSLNADEQLSFTKGISTDDEPDLWIKDYSNQIKHWIELGQPDEKRIRQACAKAEKVSIYCYSGHGAQLWWEQISPQLERFEHLRVINLDATALESLAQLADRSMDLSAFIQDGEISISNGDANIGVPQTHWK